MHEQMNETSLRAEIAHPGNLAHAERRAAAALDAARARGRLATGNIDAIYKYAVDTLARQRPPLAILTNPQTPAEREAVDAYSVARLRFALEMQAAMGWLATLSDTLLGAITVATGEDRPKATRALCQQHEVWAAWSDSFYAECARIDEVNARNAAASAAAYMAAQPANALAAAEATGIVLKLDAAGENIIAPAAHNLSEAVLAELVEHKAAVVAILAARVATKVIA